MRIPIPGGGHISLRDDHPDAIKIRQGFKYEVQNEAIEKNGKTREMPRLVFKEDRGFDREAFIDKLKKGNISMKDVQDYLLEELT